jgi:predicted enzyme related to lactoylglutathione lyase
MAGEIVHIEIPAQDMGAQREFWGSLFGWEFQNFPGGPGDYWIGRIDDTSGAALTGMEPGMKGTRTYFSVDDINAGAARVRELGGDSRDPTPVPGMGWFVTCTDPEGSEFGLWQTDPDASM